MKKGILFGLCFALMVLCAACGRPSSVASEETPGSAVSSSVPVQSSQAGAESGSDWGENSASASASDSSMPEIDTTGWVKHFISLPVTNEQGDFEKKGLVIVRTPATWEFDNYTTFSLDGRKILEVLNLRAAGTGDDPIIPEAMTQPYQDNSYYPEGYGLITSETTALNGSALMILHMKTWPDDAEAPWYPQYAFYEVADHVVEMHFYTDKESDPDDAALFRAVLGTTELYFAEESSSTSPSAASAAP